MTPWMLDQRECFYSNLKKNFLTFFTYHRKFCDVVLTLMIPDFQTLIPFIFTLFWEFTNCYFLLIYNLILLKIWVFIIT